MDSSFERKALEFDDLLEELGVEIPFPETVKKAKEVSCGDKAQAAPRRHTEWSNIQSFESVGYVAKVTQTTCEGCGSMREHLEGVFHVEVKKTTGARRMQAIKRGQIPLGGEYRVEVAQAFETWCCECMGAMGFKNYVEAEDHPFDIRIPG